MTNSDLIHAKLLIEKLRDGDEDALDALDSLISTYYDKVKLTATQAGIDSKIASCVSFIGILQWCSMPALGVDEVMCTSAGELVLPARVWQDALEVYENMRVRAKAANLSYWWCV